MSPSKACPGLCWAQTLFIGNSFLNLLVTTQSSWPSVRLNQHAQLFLPPHYRCSTSLLPSPLNCEQESSTWSRYSSSTQSWEWEPDIASDLELSLCVAKLHLAANCSTESCKSLFNESRRSTSPSKKQRLLRPFLELISKTWAQSMNITLKTYRMYCNGSLVCN